jgi:hypothetical protein
VNQWASSINTDKALTEIVNLKAKYPWLKCPETLEFIKKMDEDLPKILNIIKMQEKQNAVLRRSDEITRGYIHANGLADEVILDDLKKKFNIDI